MSSRVKIITAAVEMMKRGPDARLSVRAVAAEAGVSVGTLRHFFPTQRQLQDTVLTSIYETAFPDGSIHDRSITARDRLIACLRHVLESPGSIERTREIWTDVFARVIAADATAEARADYLVRTRYVRGRIEYWLTALANEGALPQGDTTRRAKFLLIIVNGILIERVMPSDDSLLQTETDVLYTAVDAVFAGLA